MHHLFIDLFIGFLTALHYKVCGWVTAVQTYQHKYHVTIQWWKLLSKCLQNAILGKIANKNVVALVMRRTPAKLGCNLTFPPHAKQNL